MKDSAEKKERKFVIRFNNFAYNYADSKMKKLNKEMKMHFRMSGRKNEILVDISAILDIYLIENANIDLEDIFYYKSKIKKTHRISDSITTKFKDFTVDDFDIYYLLISQSVLPYARTVEIAEELCQKSLKALENLLKHQPEYQKLKCNYHFNMVERCLKADFFEIDHINDEEGSKLVKDIYNHHLSEALKICEETDVIEEKVKAWLKIKAALMERNSEDVIENFEYISKNNQSKTFNDMVREEISYYSFDTRFSLNQRHLNIALGIRVLKLRERNGIHRETLARQLGYVGGQMVQNIERGDSAITVFQLARIADCFGVTVEELCYGRAGRRKEPLKKEDF